MTDPAAILRGGPMAAQSPAVEAALFYLLAGLTAAAAVAVVASGSIVRTSAALLFALVGVAGLFALLGAEFLAAVQLVVYVGGTLILIVFGVMLTSPSPFARLGPTRGEAAVAVALAAVLVTTLVAAAMSSGDAAPPGAAARRPLDPDVPYPTAALGLALLGDYLLPFELASVILLAVMIGAAYLARARRRRGQDGDEGSAAQSPASGRIDGQPSAPKGRLNHSLGRKP